MEPERDKRRKDGPSGLEIYDSEGGRARYPEGFKIRGHDANKLLDRIRGTDDEKACGEPDSNEDANADVTDPE